jgi:Na+/melibiose symporter-like transporter
MVGGLEAAGVLDAVVHLMERLSGIPPLWFGISLIWPIFDNYVPIFLKEDFALSATLIGFIMTWDNYLNMFVQPIVGERSDLTYTRFGRRKPWILVGAPLAAIFFIFIPLAGPQVVGILIQLTGDNYRVMFAFSALFMILAGVCMAKVKDPFRSLKSHTLPPDLSKT